MKKLFLALALVATLSAPALVHAQATSLSIESVGSQIGLGNADAKQTTINIIRWSLGLLGLIAVAAIIFGLISLASGGEDGRERAIRVITGAIIGLVIVILAWAIVVYVTNTTVNVTNT